MSVTPAYIDVELIICIPVPAFLVLYFPVLHFQSRIFSAPSPVFRINAPFPPYPPSSNLKLKRLRHLKVPYVNSFRVQFFLNLFLLLFVQELNQTKSTFGNSVGSRILPFLRASVACLFKRSRNIDEIRDLGHDSF